MIDVVTLDLTLGPTNKDREEGINLILRRGWKGFDNFSDDELKELIALIDPKKAEGLLLCAQMLSEAHADEGSVRNQLPK